MGYELPAGIILGSAILGIALDSFDAVEKVKNYFVPQPIMIDENYMIFPMRSLVDQESGSREVYEKSWRVFAQELSNQFPDFLFASPAYMERAWSFSASDAIDKFCSFSSSEQGQRDLKDCTDKAVIDWIDVVSYSVTNRNSFSIAGMSFILRPYGEGGEFTENIDIFFADTEENGDCLTSELADGGCIARRSGQDEIIDVPQSIEIGQKLVLPLYLGLRLSYTAEEGPSNYDGYVVAPFRLPLSVTVNDRVIVEKSRPMSLTPMISKGEYEIRG
ncbi:hypothetical protein [Methylobrevis albus]|uniref:Uncharacterized protein n=1 Tax=Methylobrevis albus TaxID=2793297 RepID=A0A931I172_9HYPH|nr:hypothetical protein [Methylobrevis albus]MBH0237081.1 hypothetical protein [Methylobrevis albus]